MNTQINEVLKNLSQTQTDLDICETAINSLSLYIDICEIKKQRVVPEIKIQLSEHKEGRIKLKLRFLTVLKQLNQLAEKL